MNCAHYRESIQELVDGTIGPIRRAELERHLDTCADCTALVADLRAIRDAAASLDPLEPPDGVWLQIAGRLRQEGLVPAPLPEPAASRSRVALLALAAALVLAVGGSIVLLWPQFRAAQSSAAVTPAPAPPSSTGNAQPEVAVESVEEEFRLAEQHYQNAIAK